MRAVLSLVRRIIPQPLLSLYHLTLSFAGAVMYGFPSRKLIVVGVTGTKGKSSTAEFLNSILETAGQKTALSSTIRFKIGELIIIIAVS